MAFSLEFDENRLIHECEVDNNNMMNAKQFAGMMANNPNLAKMVATSLPWYAFLEFATDEEYAIKCMETAEDEYDVYLERIAEDV